jgi:hypothetical protein
MKHQKSCTKCLPSFAMQALARRVQECLYFEDFPELRFELATKLQTEKHSGDLQDAEYLFMAVFQFRQEFFFCN